MELKEFKTALIDALKDMDELYEMPEESTNDLIEKIERSEDAHEAYGILCDERNIDADMRVETLLTVLVKI